MVNQRENAWPVLTRYDQAHLARIALPLGGIGTGTVSLGGRGDLRDWEIVNRPAKGFTPAIGRESGPFFALFALPAGGKAVTRLIEGPLELEAYEGSHGSKAKNHGLPRFRTCSFAAAYPLGQVMLSDPDVPLQVRIEAFNPLIPADADKSGIPVAVLRYVLINQTDRAIAASVCGSIPNFIGADGWNVGRDWKGDVDDSLGPKANRNVFRTGKEPALSGERVCHSEERAELVPSDEESRVRLAKGRDGEQGVAQGIFMSSDGVDPQAEQWGTIALATTAASGVTCRTAWARLTWGDSLLDFWDDFSSDGELEERDAEGPALSGEGVDAPVASLAVQVEVPPGDERAVTFVLTWHFPNRPTWQPRRPSSSWSRADVCCLERVGNYYATQYADAWDVVEKVVPALPQLEAETLRFVRAFCDSDLPGVVKEAALYNLSTLRSQTCFRTADGQFYGWEGSCDTCGCCFGSCTHVWNYEQATAFLFGDLARSMRQVEFAHATRDDGLMSFRVHLPLERAQEYGLAAADGQMGCLLKLYRDWQLSGDDEMLRSLWPKARQALQFCWIAGGWDADRDGVMEGCQHNTMDVEYYGPNPQMGTWYLGALRATEEMARYLGEDDLATACRQLCERGSRWIDAHLFNGEYYEHEIRPPGVGCFDPRGSAVAAGLRAGMGAESPTDPVLQLGAGCLVDQLVGQYMAHVCGLGYLLDAENVRKTLQSIVKYNFREGFYGHLNHMRSFVLGDEAGLLMATYPRGRRPKRPFPYYNEVMTGFEYSTAVHMLYEGQIEEGLKCMRAIRERYDGRKRNPFDEAECGHHYARAMASWAAVLALTGFRYSAVERSMAFAAREGLHFWSNGYAWGTCRQEATGDGMRVDLQVLHGSLTLERFEIAGAGNVTLEAPITIGQGESISWLAGGTCSASRSPEHGEGEKGKREKGEGAAEGKVHG